MINTKRACILLLCATLFSGCSIIKKKKNNPMRSVEYNDFIASGGFVINKEEETISKAEKDKILSVAEAIQYDVGQLPQTEEEMK